MRVDDLADARTGDKGDTFILAVLPRGHEAWLRLREQLTPDLVRSHFGAAVTGQTRRAELRQLAALVFRIPGVLAGGVTGALTLDGHGKALSYHLLALELPEVHGS